MKIDKKTYEHDAFSEFIRVAGIACDEGSIEHHYPPEPDISCRIHGQRHYFELVRLSEPDIEKKVLTGQSGYSNFSMGPKELAFAIQAKAKKSYRAEGPIDLVIHEGATPIDGLWAHFDETHLLQLMKENAEGSAFAKIWLVDFSSERFLVRVIRGRTV